MKRTDIYGCAERGDVNKLYLTRYTLLETKYFQVCIHVFHRSDGPDLHDHPWNFLSLILWNGYIEHTPEQPHEQGLSNSNTLRRRVWPGMILFRRATHIHRVELLKGSYVQNHFFERPGIGQYDKKAVILVIMGRKFREWNFFTRSGFKMNWKDYFTANRC